MKYPNQKNNASDHFQTPPVALEQLLPYLKNDWWIWECACGKGNLVDALKDKGYRVMDTDIEKGGDFLTGNLEADCIVTNPPYSLKDEFLERCYQLGKPFALLLPLTVFDSARRRKLFAKHGVEVIFLPRRLSFETPNHHKNVATGKKTSAWFATCWITHGLNIGLQLTFTD